MSSENTYQKIEVHFSKKIQSNFSLKMMTNLIFGGALVVPGEVVGNHCSMFLIFWNASSKLRFWLEF